MPQLAKPGQNEFAVLFSRFVSYKAERIEEYSSSSFTGPGCLSKSLVEVLFWSSLKSFMTATSGAFKDIVPPLLPPFPPSRSGTEEIL